MLLTGFLIKPAYMTLALVLILLLRKQKNTAMVLIRWSLITFLAGELFCAANYILAGGQCETLDILHGLGMVGFSVFLPWGLFVLADEYVLRFSNETANCSLLK